MNQVKNFIIDCLLALALVPVFLFVVLWHGSRRVLNLPRERAEAARRAEVAAAYPDRVNDVSEEEAFKKSFGDGK